MSGTEQRPRTSADLSEGCNKTLKLHLVKPHRGIFLVLFLEPWRFLSRRQILSETFIFFTQLLEIISDVVGARSVLDSGVLAKAPSVERHLNSVQFNYYFKISQKQFPVINCLRIFALPRKKTMRDKGNSQGGRR